MNRTPPQSRPHSPFSAMPAAIAKSGDARCIALPSDGGPHGIFKDYPGAKGGAGVWQTIINQIPPHDVWIEVFAGSGQVTRHKRPAPAANIVVDVDAKVIAAWRNVPGVTAICADARCWLPAYPWTGREVLYCDPPYLRSVRSCPRDYYRHEFASEREHTELLSVLRALPCRVILSGYASPLYTRTLADWRVVTFQAVNRRGRKVTECLWMNFPETLALHDYRFLGRDFRERERIKRKKARWLAKLSRMPLMERAAILDAVAVLTAGNGEGIRKDAGGIITNADGGSHRRKCRGCRTQTP